GRSPATAPPARRRCSAACRPSSASPTCRGPRTWPTRSGSPSPAWPASPAACPRAAPASRDDRRMIASLRGPLRARLEDRVILEAAGVGYEVFTPPVTQEALAKTQVGEGDAGDEVSLAVHYHATQNQPRPVLIGFTSDLDKEFFEKLITVKDVGPMVAARALALPVGELAAAIARQDEKFLRGLPGVGPQKAKNMVAQLQNKVAKFALAPDSP